MLKVISGLDADLTNMVKFYEEFQHMETTCLVFERLDMSLYDLLLQREWEHHPLHEIRPVAKQLLVALDALKGLGVLHTDIKPDNIMFVNMKDQPLRVKLIDFGCAMMASQVELGMEIQPCGYMAPEISLGLPFSEAVDVWGVGCILAFLYLAQNLFSVDCQYQMMKNMVTVLGQPQDHLLRAGMYSEQFFIEEYGEDSPSWRLMTAEEFTAVSNVETEEEESFIELPNSLNGLIHVSTLSCVVRIHPKLGAAEMEDRMAFVSLLEGLLHLDGDERISPRQALELPFISMSHLREDVHSRD
ncbi:homeodomain-interacting protein kinase 3-like isoform X1 [Hippoglossus hippoglossus]|uniref:homeodomain-interacting protein kinase 3-like isoform X1 n=1 Tax=Hippoglossus hippoglossus TaxID=8267 RepID=UPI00148E6C74|nr:homeodomain-interacting protein kinase 3-like isoform X1 [Hippoglossus hippoglossus]